MKSVISLSSSKLNYNKAHIKIMLVSKFRDISILLFRLSKVNKIQLEEKQINYMDILKHIIPLICLLTINDDETSFVEMLQTSSDT